MKILNKLFYFSIIFISFDIYAQNSGGLAPLRKPNPAQSIQTDVQNAEARENLKICLDGKYPSLCNQFLLSEEQKDKVNRAEIRENLKICLDGSYPSLCKNEILLYEQKIQVQKSE